ALGPGLLAEPWPDSGRRPTGTDEVWPFAASPSGLRTGSSSWSPARRTGLWGGGGHPRIYWRLITSFPAVRSLQPSASRRSLHGHMAYLFGGEPVAQGQQIVGHRPERPNRLARLTLRARHDHTRHYSLLVHVQSTTALIQNVHTTPSLGNVRVGTWRGAESAVRASQEGSNNWWCLKGTQGPTG